MRLHLFFILLATAVSTSGCTSYFVRKDCEKIDWYKHGESVAMSGNRLTGNDVIHRCEGAEANIDYVGLDQGFKKGMETYCQPETVLAIGKRGELFSTEMCDGDHIRLLRQKHAEGVQSYCQKANGYSAGIVGKPYNQICPKELEGAFLPEFNRGRKSFLTAEVIRTDGAIEDLDSEIARISSERDRLYFEHSTLGGGQRVIQTRSEDPYTHIRTTETHLEDDPNIQSQKSNLMMRINGLDSEINTKREEQSRLREQKRTMNAELMTL